jgi:chromosome segregation ATPase
MKSATKDKVYTSPVRKLARFFEKSRDQWKAKCRAAKQTIKYLQNRVRFLEESRERWKSRAQELEARVKQLEGQAGEAQAEVAQRAPVGQKNN